VNVAEESALLRRVSHLGSEREPPRQYAQPAPCHPEAKACPERSRRAAQECSPQRKPRVERGIGNEPRSLPRVLSLQVPKHETFGVTQICPSPPSPRRAVRLQPGLASNHRSLYSHARENRRRPESNTPPLIRPVRPVLSGTCEGADDLGHILSGQKATEAADATPFV